MGCQLREDTSNKMQDTNKSQILRFKFEICCLFLVCFLFLASCIFDTSTAQTTYDPLTIGVGARALGMGKAYVAVAENCDTIFTNPAGLGEIDSFEFVSMSGQLLDEVNYLVLGAVYPIGDKSALGFGFADASLGGVEVRDSGAVLLSTSSFSDRVFLTSYGRKITEKLSFGLNLKFFTQDGGQVSNADGSGFNVDLGFLQKGLGWLSLGLVGQNLLSSSKMRYGNGTAEQFPLSVKIGTRMFIMGQEFESAILSDFELVAAVDADLSFQASEPTTTHLGLEFSPNTFLTLRTGVDQDPVPGGLQNNMTYGISLHWAGIGFHYAYHPYTEFVNNVTHYLSLSFDERGWPFEGLPDRFLGDKKPDTRISG